jgi:hypothetical protein
VTTLSCKQCFGPIIFAALSCSLCSLELAEGPVINYRGGGGGGGARGGGGGGGGGAGGKRGGQIFLCMKKVRGQKFLCNINTCRAWYIALSCPYQTDRYVADICHSSVKYLQNICTKVSVTYLQHIGIWPHNISVTVMWQYSFPTDTYLLDNIQIILT